MKRDCSRGSLTIYLILLLLTVSSSVDASAWSDYLDQAQQVRRADEPDSALKLAHRALAVARAHHGDIDSSSALVLHRIGTWWHTANTDSAEYYYRQAIDIWKQLDDQQFNYSRTLNNLALLQPLTETVRLLQQVADIRRECLPPDDPGLARTLSKLGRMLGELGRYQEGEACVLEAMVILGRRFPGDSTVLVGPMISLGNISYNSGQHDRAERLFQTIERLVRRQGNTEGIIGMLTSRSAVNLAMFRFHRAESLAVAGLQMLDTAEVPSGRRSMMQSDLLKNLGVACRYTERYDEALDYHQQDFDIVSQLLPELHPERLRAEYNLAHSYRTVGDYVTADSIYAVMNPKLEVSFGPYSYMYTTALAASARTRLYAGDTATAASLARESYALASRAFVQAAPAMAEPEALRRANVVGGSGMTYLSCALGQLDDRSRLKSDPAAASIMLNIKGPVTEHMRRKRDWVALSAGLDSSSQAAEYVRLRQQLADRFMAAVGSGDVASFLDETDSLEQEVLVVERQLRTDGVSCGEVQSPEQQLTKILETLDPGVTVVEYLRVERPTGPQQREYQYAATVLKHDTVLGPWLLAAAPEVDRAVEKYRSHLYSVARRGRLPGRADADTCRTLASDVARLIWWPLTRYLAEEDTVVVAADAALNAIDFAALPLPDGDYSLRYHTFAYLPTSRLILERHGARSQSSGSLLALGAPDFRNRMSTASAQHAHTTAGDVADLSAGSPILALRGLADACITSYLVFQPLPGTADEVRMIADLWESGHGNTVCVVTGAAATEDVFVEESPGHDYLHVATHGFYLDPECFQDQGGATSINPMLLSGLVFAGANDSSSADGARDGFLTALELALMDLSDTRLAVLSACESGMGTVYQGEGVFGLRRAFLMAGVEHLVSALWPVSDRFVPELMSRLYERSQTPVCVRLRQSQLEQLDNLERRGFSDHPFFWAGWIAVGDWR